MQPTSNEPITTLLARSRQGDRDASNRLAKWIERIVRRELLKQSATMSDTQQQPTDVVNEVVLKMLRGQTFDSAPNRRYLAVAAARTTRNVLVDALRRQSCEKRGGSFTQHQLDQIVARIAERGLDLLALDEALTLLAQENPRRAEIVDLRFFGGYSHREIAGLLQVSVTTIETDWYAAKKWLYQLLETDSHEI